MSLGRVDAFFDVFIERDLQAGRLTEPDAQELIDHFVMKLRLVRHLRPKSYDEIFAGDPTWVTATLGGRTSDGNSLVTKTSFRLIHTLTNLGPAPEPNLTILWDPNLPQPFKVFCGPLAADHRLTV
jgi:formate C-acetyltransferase